MRTTWTLACLVALLVVVSTRPAAADDAEVLAWERALAGSRASVATRAAARTGLAQSRLREEAVAAVRRLLAGASPVARMEGARVAGLLGDDGLLLLPDLLENLTDRISGVRSTAAEAVGKVAREAADRARVVDRLARALDDEHPEVQASAITALTDLGALSEPDVADRLLRAPQRHEMLATLFEQVAAAEPVVGALLRARSWHLRALGLHTLLELVRRTSKATPLEPWRPVLAEVVREDASGYVRASAVALLGSAAQYDEGIAADLAPALQDPDPVVRARAYTIVDRVGLAAAPAVTDLLVEGLHAAGPEARASAAWLLREAPAAQEGLEDALRSLLSSDDPRARRSAAASLLHRGRFDASVVPHLVAFVEQAGVEQPYPEPPGTYQEGSGGGRRLGSSWPMPNVSASWATRVLRQAGPAVAPALVARLRAAPAGEGLVWVHALGHTGAPGLLALRAEYGILDAHQRFAYALARIHGGDTTPGLVAPMVDALRAFDGKADVDYGDPDNAWRRMLLASAALTKLGAPAVDALIEVRRMAAPGPQGQMPYAYNEAGSILVRIGPAAVEAMRRAAADRDRGHGFRDLLDQIER